MLQVARRLPPNINLVGWQTGEILPIFGTQKVMSPEPWKSYRGSRGARAASMCNEDTRPIGRRIWPHEVTLVFNGKAELLVIQPQSEGSRYICEKS